MCITEIVLKCATRKINIYHGLIETHLQERARCRACNIYKSIVTLQNSRETYCGRRVARIYMHAYTVRVSVQVRRARTYSYMIRVSNNSRRGLQLAFARCNFPYASRGVRTRR